MDFLLPAPAAAVAAAAARRARSRAAARSARAKFGLNVHVGLPPKGIISYLDASTDFNSTSINIGRPRNVDGDDHGTARTSNENVDRTNVEDDDDGDDGTNDAYTLTMTPAGPERDDDEGQHPDPQRRQSRRGGGPCAGLLAYVSARDRVRRSRLLVALVLAGCAGDDGRLTKAEYAETVRTVYARGAGGVRRDERRPRASSPSASRTPRRSSGTPPASSRTSSRRRTPRRRTRRSRRASGSTPTSSTGCATRPSAATSRRSTTSTRGIAQRESVGQIAEAAESLKFRGYDLGQIAEE